MVTIDLEMSVYMAIKADDVLVICSNITEGCLDREVAIEFATVADQTATGITHCISSNANEKIV